MPLNDDRPHRTTGLPRRLSRRVAAAGIAAVAGVAAVVAVATQTSVLHAEPGAPAPETTVPTIAAESTSEDAPEQAPPATPVPAPAATAAAYDPPTIDEVAYVRYLVSQDPSYAGTASVGGGVGAQYLSADLADPSLSADGGRRYTLFYFDYAADQLLHYVVNVTTGTVESVTEGAGVQPAPTDQETLLAFQLLLADPLSQGIKDEFRAATGEELTDPAQTTFTAHAYTAGPADLGAESCGVQRCVQLMAQAPDGRYLTTTPLVVNLSAQTVTSIK
ncbi:hypothetical protein [Jiangella rhizosphaerae]|uniref:Tat pathway signal sequence domain protein n=1 Tax=Jiangella rhizosphaerae TaxID=2293569 RepID=A0A418KJC9_9ACTN|nr:hypothetical protein [Jiangella rhizosphaerae]RIQ14461.1 hypothetical protein DY240_24680 [Jiangella rhizosphaerae]